MQEDIGIETIIVRETELDVTDLDGEKVIIDMTKGNYFSLNLVGSCIWSKIEKPQSIKRVIEELLDEYEVDEATCKYEVLNFCKQLHSMALIKVVIDKQK